MADLAKMLEDIKKMTVTELNEFVKMIETEFGVSAAAMAVAAPGAGGGEAAPAAEEQTEFTLILKAVDASKKIAAIKIVREITGLGLGEAKALVDNVPSTIKEGVGKESADEYKKKFADEAGATLELK